MEPLVNRKDCATQIKTKFIKKITKCCIVPPAHVWVLHTPNAGGNSHFQWFLQEKIMFLPVKMRKNLLKLEIKQSTRVLVKT